MITSYRSGVNVINPITDHLGKISYEDRWLSVSNNKIEYDNLMLMCFDKNNIHRISVLMRTKYIRMIDAYFTRSCIKSYDKTTYIEYENIKHYIDQDKFSDVLKLHLKALFINKTIIMHLIDEDTTGDLRKFYPYAVTAHAIAQVYVEYCTYHIIDNKLLYPFVDMKIDGKIEELYRSYLDLENKNIKTIKQTFCALTGREMPRKYSPDYTKIYKPFEREIDKMIVKQLNIERSSYRIETNTLYKMLFTKQAIYIRGYVKVLDTLLYELKRSNNKLICNIINTLISIWLKALPFDVWNIENEMYVDVHTRLKINVDKNNPTIEDLRIELINTVKKNAIRLTLDVEKLNLLLNPLIGIKMISFTVELINSVLNYVNKIDIKGILIFRVIV